jgi:hypothetical protein
MSQAKIFAYTSLVNQLGETDWKPVLPIVLENKGRVVKVSGLVDSGAGINVLPYQIGQALGFVWEQQTFKLRLSGNLARQEARGVNLFGMVGDWPPVELVFAWTKAENVPLIFGEMNFFKEFDVCFFRSRLAFAVQPRGMGELEAALI